MFAPCSDRLDLAEQAVTLRLMFRDVSLANYLVLISRHVSLVKQRTHMFAPCSDRFDLAEQAVTLRLMFRDVSLANYLVLISRHVSFRDVSLANYLVLIYRHVSLVKQRTHTFAPCSDRF